MRTAISERVRDDIRNEFDICIRPKVYTEELAGQAAAEMEYVKHEDRKVDPYGINTS